MEWREEERTNVKGNGIKGMGKEDKKRKRWEIAERRKKKEE